MPSSQIFKALADDTRRAIVEDLAAGPLPVHRIAERYAMSRPAVSKHLRVLADCGLVTAAKAGKETLYALEAAELEAVRQWIGRFWRGRLETLRRLSETDA
jgi:DNA-binding transcriptional ArsR family regulator